MKKIRESAPVPTNEDAVITTSKVSMMTSDCKQLKARARDIKGSLLGKGMVTQKRNFFKQLDCKFYIY